MIHMFLDDTAMYAVPTIGPSGYSSTNQGAGYLTDNIPNYFLQGSRINDLRGLNRLQVLPSNAIPSGRMELHFDSDKITTELDGFTATDYTNLFNIIEYLAYTPNASNVDVETILATTPYNIYKANSIITSVTSTTVTINTITNPITTAIDDWIQFTVVINGVDIIFNIYISENSFINDYPYSNITKVIPPCDPINLLNMSNYSNPTDAIAKSATYITGLYNTDVAASDHNGVYNFTTPYHDSNTISNYNLTFGILYKGKAPSLATARLAVKNYLISTTLTTEVTWKTLFPELWSTGSFFLIPMWDKTYTLPMSIMYQNIISNKLALAKADSLLLLHTLLYIQDHVEILNSSAIETQILAVPNVDNPVGTTSLVTLHPTYMAIDATSPNWNNQTAVTRDLNQKISNCIGIGLGGNNTWGYSIVTKNNKDWYLFNVNGIDFYLILPASYGV